MSLNLPCPMDGAQMQQLPDGYFACPNHLQVRLTPQSAETLSLANLVFTRLLPNLSEGQPAYHVFLDICRGFNKEFLDLLLEEGRRREGRRDVEVEQMLLSKIEQDNTLRDVWMTMQVMVEMKRGIRGEKPTVPDA